jgi:hypothetical protein
MAPADTHQAVDIPLVADTHQVAVHILVVDTRQAAAHIPVVGCYKDLLAGVALGERTHQTDLADLGLGPD